MHQETCLQAFLLHGQYLEQQVQLLIQQWLLLTQAQLVLLLQAFSLG
jgi:hypothetical protein